MVVVEVEVEVIGGWMDGWIGGWVENGDSEWVRGLRIDW